VKTPSKRLPHLDNTNSCSLSRSAFVAALAVAAGAGPVAGRPQQSSRPSAALAEGVLFDPQSGREATPLVRPLDATDGLVLHGVRVDALTYLGRKAIHMVNDPATAGNAFAIVPGIALQDGTIDIEVAGKPEAGASPNARGFIGVAFRIASDPSRFECIYVRPTNGRADDQLRRNHATQYISSPDFPFDRLRREAPGVYESYVDLVAGEWTHLRITVSGQSASLFVNHSLQPSLIVHDLKHRAQTGLVGLWIGDETDGYFRNLEVVPSR
jgi:hypothetical protein